MYVACTLVDNCVACVDAAGPGSTPSAPTDVACTECSAGFALDLPGMVCAGKSVFCLGFRLMYFLEDCSDIVGCTACTDANTAMQAASPATIADITCTACGANQPEMDGSCPAVWP